MSDHKNGASPPDQSIVVQIADKSRADATGRPVGQAGDAQDKMRNQASTEEAMHRPLTGA